MLCRSNVTRILKLLHCSTYRKLQDIQVPKYSYDVGCLENIVLVGECQGVLGRVKKHTPQHSLFKFKKKQGGFFKNMYFFHPLAPPSISPLALCFLTIGCVCKFFQKCFFKSSYFFKFHVSNYFSYQTLCTVKHIFVVNQVQQNALCCTQYTTKINLNVIYLTQF